jgi:HAD superfamily hydrolase (TIGR01549 family)
MNTVTSTPSRARAVTFDYGQTLAELDTGFLSTRALEWGAAVDRARLDAASATAWTAYDDAKRSGLSGQGAWTAFMTTLLTGAGVASTKQPGADLTARLVEYLWSEQPRRNLWRRHIAGMKDLVQELVDQGIPLGIVSNSEGRLAELLEDVGLHHYFGFVADSGLLGFEKPDPRIFQYAARGLGVETSELVHVGDAWVADIEGALAVGASAIWVTGDHASTTRELPPGVVACAGADAIRAALRAFDIPARSRSSHEGHT